MVGTVGPGLDLPGEGQQQVAQLAQQQVERLALAQHLGVVLDIHRGRAQVDDPAADRALLGIGAHLGHQVVVDLRLDLQRPRQVDLIGVVAQIGDLLRRHQPGGLFRFGQRHPDAPPQPPLACLAPELRASPASRSAR